MPVDMVSHSSSGFTAKSVLSRRNLPVSFSPKRVRNMVKLRGPGASDIIPSTTLSLGSWPVRGRRKGRGKEGREEREVGRGEGGREEREEGRRRGR